jgi:hypothetical protein
MSGSIAFLGAAIVLLAVSTGLGSEGETVFPRVEGKALTGDKFEVPGDLGRARNLILVAFLREHQEDIDTWIPRADSLEKAFEDFTFYEFPILPEMNAVSRWFIYRGMRSGITSDSARARTVTFHLDKQPFRESLGIESEDYISVFLVNAEGAVLWRATGKWNREKEQDLRKTLGKAPRGDDAGGGNLPGTEEPETD